MRAFPIVAALVVLAMPASAVAGGASQSRSNPYSGLFVGQLGGNAQQKQPAPVLPSSPTPLSPNVTLPTQPRSPQVKERVICGMTVAQGDAKIDPRMPQHPPANAPKASIGIMPAPACRK